ncbi:MAG: iron ABC transporter permease [Firmicutes bacterium]|jgi:iron(III) transport system permease protein|nr:iron ABC transporter permease [Bacillota bacterium]
MRQSRIHQTESRSALARFAAKANPAVWPIFIFLALFIIFPFIKLFYDAFTTRQGAFTLQHFVDFFRDPYYMKSLRNSLTLGVATVATTSVIGFIVAYVLVRYEFPGRRLFSYLTVVPIVMPPLVGVMGFIFILGRAGTLNVILMDYLGLMRPINFIYGWHGLLLVETLHLFPLISLNVVDALGKIDASLEEAAESVGSVGLRKTLDVTIPLTTPGFVTGALLVFIWAFADFATPLVVGLQDFLASQAYLNIVQFIDKRLFQMGISIGVVMILLSVVFLFVAKKYVSLRDYSSLSYRPVERRILRGLARFAVPAFLTILTVLAFIPYLGVTLAAFGRAWSLTPFPTSYTLHHFNRVIVETPKYIVNTFLYCGLAVILCIVVGVPVAWILARTKMRTRGFLDSLITLVLALPGTALGIAYIRAFNVPLPGVGIALTGLWIIIPLVLAVRRLPYTVRSTYGSLLVIHRSLEEAAASVGASGARTFLDITLPLIWKGVLAGALFSFMTSIQESAATILLAIPGWETMTVGIFAFYTSGSINDAAALGVILIAVGSLTLLVINRLAGARAGGFFG